MKPQRPYLLRAFYDWIVDSGCTPHLLVDASLPGVEVPRDAVENDRIVLNVSPTAVRGFHLGDDAVTFECRFGGVPWPVRLPPGSVLAIYARENGAGMAFEGAETPEPPPGDGGDDDGGPPRGGHLKVVK
ncbi:MAG: ClpXP protease specificity-enhancing factor [Pseudomonadales bacterium]|nr:ClpXP protease specificity-enhancing factor [Pseudomonadales bacterium]